MTDDERSLLVRLTYEVIGLLERETDRYGANLNRRSDIAELRLKIKPLLQEGSTSKSPDYEFGREHG